jgi:hypothetical protein
VFLSYNLKCYPKIAHPKEDELKCYFRIALSESESIKVLPMGSPPTSGAIEMIYRNQSFKEMFS